MKKCIAWLLLAATMLTLCGCSTAAAPSETAAESTVVEETTAAAEETAAAPTDAGTQEEHLFVKVSSITFSLVGESEDVYLGLVPREFVTWESEDPSVIAVENGVLTAIGVGTTTIRASYEDQLVEITAGCLAATQEELSALDSKVRSEPKRLPPQVILKEPCSYFDNAAIVGDSITYFLMQWESKTNYLGNMLFLARGGVSMNGFVRRFKNIYYQGREAVLEEAIGKSGVERVYFLMGSNDISSSTQRPYLKENWVTLLDRIREKSPEVEIVLLSNIPLYGSDQDAKNTDFTDYNQRIAEYNVWLKQFAEENNCLYLDLNYYVQDHNGRMPEIYSQGSYHMNEAGCLNWMKILRYYAQYELEGGKLA